MTLNPRAVLRLSTRLTLSLILLCGFGMILWLIDTVLQWNILPDALDIYVELILVVFASITGLSILTSIICLLGITGEWLSQKAHFDQAVVSKRSKIRIAIGFVIMGLVLCGFYIIDESKKINVDAEEERLEAQEYSKMSAALDSSLAENLKSSQSLLAQQLTDMPNRGKEMAQIITSMKKSLPFHPAIELLTPAEPPYKYQILSLNDTTVAVQNLFSFPSQVENKVAEDLLNYGNTEQPFLESGTFFAATHPHAWKIIKSEEGNKAVLMVRAVND